MPTDPEDPPPGPVDLGEVMNWSDEAFHALLEHLRRPAEPNATMVDLLARRGITPLRGPAIDRGLALVEGMDVDLDAQLEGEDGE